MIFGKRIGLLSFLKCIRLYLRSKFSAAVQLQQREFARNTVSSELVVLTGLKGGVGCLFHGFTPMVTSWSSLTGLLINESLILNINFCLWINLKYRGNHRSSKLPVRRQTGISFSERYHFKLSSQLQKIFLAKK